MKPFSESCEQNKLPILAVLQEALAKHRVLLEIGSGTGQHAVFFAQQLPHLEWHTSDVSANHPGIRQWLAESPRPNLHGPYALDVNQGEWPLTNVDALFSANTTHIMDWPSVVKLFAGIGRVLVPEGRVCLYGPFNYNGQYTSESNAHFDQWLKVRDPLSGIRDFEAMNVLAGEQGLDLLKDYPMPANNRILVWQKSAASI